MHESWCNAVAVSALALVAAGCSRDQEAAPSASTPPPAVSTVAVAHGRELTFHGGFPTEETIQKVYEDTDARRAIEAYRFFYPVVSLVGLTRGLVKGGAIENQAFALLSADPKAIAFTANSDTPYASFVMDLRKAGPMVIEVPPGAVMGVINDAFFRWTEDLGLPGPDRGKGGKYLIVPPGYRETPPAGYFVAQSPTFRSFAVIRAVPPSSDPAPAIELLKKTRFYPFTSSKAAPPVTPSVLAVPTDATPLAWEDNLQFWEVLHSVLEVEPAPEAFRPMYGMLASLGIAKGLPFQPDERAKRILTAAAKTGVAEMRVQAFADRRADRRVWGDRKSWEWVALRPEAGTFETPSYLDLEARETWFFQATLASPAMFRRSEGAGSLYPMAARDREGQFLDGSKTYKLNVPMPVPVKLFWSATVYDPDTRSEIATDQNRAAIRSRYETFKTNADGSVDLYFGPRAPAGLEGQWVKTIPGKGFFLYFRLYGPEPKAFDNSWKPSDLVETQDRAG